MRALNNLSFNLKLADAGLIVNVGSLISDMSLIQCLHLWPSVKNSYLIKALKKKKDLNPKSFETISNSFAQSL